jgi:hypothetical protein
MFLWSHRLIFTKYALRHIGLHTQEVYTTYDFVIQCSLHLLPKERIQYAVWYPSRRLGKKISHYTKKQPVQKALFLYTVTMYRPMYHVVHPIYIYIYLSMYIHKCTDMHIISLFALIITYLSINIYFSLKISYRRRLHNVTAMYAFMP